MKPAQNSSNLLFNSVFNSLHALLISTI